MKIMLFLSLTCLSTIGLSQNWQVSSDNGKISSDKACVSWDTKEDKTAPRDPDGYYGTIKKGGSIGICSGGQANSVTGGVIRFVNDLDEDLNMRMLFTEFRNESCDTTRVYYPDWNFVAKKSSIETDIYGKGPINKDIGTEKYCYRLETK